MSETISAHVKSLEILRKIYCSSEIGDRGHVVIGRESYPELYADLHEHMSRLERVIASELSGPPGPSAASDSYASRGT